MKKVNFITCGKLIVFLGFLVAPKADHMAAGEPVSRTNLRQPGNISGLNKTGNIQFPIGAAQPLSLNFERPDAGRPNSNKPDDLANLGKSPALSDSEIGKAVVRALDFFARKQLKDGSWKETSSRVAHTGLVILSYLSYGVTHEKTMHKETEPYTENVKRALDWLVDQMGDNGDLQDGGRMYDQAIGTYALAEAFMVTRDENLEEPLQKALNWLVKNQIRATGGWRYYPVPNEENQGGDLSVSGWVIAALVSGKNAGAKVPQEVFEKAGAFVMNQRRANGFFAYKFKGKGKINESGDKLTMSSVGMFCLQLLGEEVMGPIVTGSAFNPDGGGDSNNNGVYRKRINETAGLLMRNIPDVSQLKGPNFKWPFYYSYYATFAMRIFGGEPWVAWRDTMNSRLLGLQVKDVTDDDADNDPNNVGSWKQSETVHGSAGRIVTTAWIVLTLMAPERGVLVPKPPNIGPGGQKPPNIGPGGQKPPNIGPGERKP